MKKPIQVSFRVTEEQANQLDQCRGHLGRGDCARRLLVTGLGGQDLRRLSKHVARLRTELDQHYSEQATAISRTQRQVAELGTQLQRLREDLAMTVAGVLTNLGRNLTQEEADDFVRQTLLAKSNHSD